MGNINWVEDDGVKAPDGAKYYHLIITPSKNRTFIDFIAFGYIWRYTYHFRLQRLIKV